MSGSTASMNIAQSSSLRAEAILANRSKTCCGASARAIPMADDAAPPTASMKVRRLISSPVTRVDADVAFGEVAGPEVRLPFALAAQGQANLALGRVQLPLQFGFGKARRQSSAADGHALHVDIDLARIESHARIARRGKDAAPVGV